MPQVIRETSNIMTDIDHLNTICSQTRRDIVRMVHAVQSGHPGGSLGCTEFMVAMYYDILRHSPEDFTIEGFASETVKEHYTDIYDKFYSNTKDKRTLSEPHFTRYDIKNNPYAIKILKDYKNQDY